MSQFILEIGTEEIPARFLQDAEKELLQRFESLLAENFLGYKTIQSFSTPRRLVLSIEDLAAVSTESEEIVSGPPVKVAFDMGGRPTRAAEGFVKSNGMTLDDIFTLQTDKGEYIAVKKKIGGIAAIDILSALCPEIIQSLPFPKRMHWGNGSFLFVRPLRWVLALLDSVVVPFSIAGINSSNQTMGHRVHGKGPITVSAASDYMTVIRDAAHVTLSSAERRKEIVEKGNILAAEKKGAVIWKDVLLDEVQGLVEHPVPLLGEFDSSFLEIPREVLLTSMQEHQKSFGIEDKHGNLLPHFLTVLNITPDDGEVVAKKGWERVLRARLEDARFFWKTDLQASFDHWQERLDSVIFLAPLGSMGDKGRRIAELCGWLANNMVASCGEHVAIAADAFRTGRLCKADLVSEMVKEFDTLQGIMGGVYAKEFGESVNVAQAIAEQYLPAGPDSPVPTTPLGAIVSMADKADTLVGCFGLGMIPTGTADPYALRRAALGIIRILIEKGYRLDVKSFLLKAQAVYGKRAWKLEPAESMEKLLDFFTQRLKNHFTSGGAETLYAEAILSADASNPAIAQKRLDALTAFSKSEQFFACTGTFKRVANIVRKQEAYTDLSLSGQYSHDLLSDDAEIKLAQALEAVEPDLKLLWQKEDYAAIFVKLAELQPLVDDFFDTVMVMSDDMSIRANRLNLLVALLNNFIQLADFAALQM